MTPPTTPRFEPGEIRATPGSLHTLQVAGQTAEQLLARHLAGDWGTLCESDKAANDAALTDGGRILSAYVLTSGETVWILTEALGDDGRREATTLLRPDEY